MAHVASTSVLRKHFPDLSRAVVTRYRERFDYELIHQQLLDVLASDEGTPSVDELARQMGYGRHIFWANFPELCNQVTERRSNARRKQHEERMTAHCNEIRQAVFLLHGQNTYPSARQITKHLSDAQAIRTKEGHEAWCLALEELKYPTGHLKRYI